MIKNQIMIKRYNISQKIPYHKSTYKKKIFLICHNTNKNWIHLRLKLWLRIERRNSIFRTWKVVMLKWKTVLCLRIIAFQIKQRVIWMQIMRLGGERNLDRKKEKKTLPKRLMQYKKMTLKRKNIPVNGCKKTNPLWRD